jgi:peroxiredoxin
MPELLHRRALLLSALPLFGAASRPAGAIVISMPGGGTQPLAKLKGKPVLLAYFVTDCRHCQVFLGSMNSLYQEYSAKGIEFLGVALDENPEQAVKGFVNRYQIRFPVGFVNQEQFFKFTALDPNTRPFVPILSVVQRDGTIRLQFTGRDPLLAQGSETQNLRALLNSLLTPGKPAAKKN